MTQGFKVNDLCNPFGASEFCFATPWPGGGHMELGCVDAPAGIGSMIAAAFDEAFIVGRLLARSERTLEIREAASQAVLVLPRAWIVGEALIVAIQHRPATVVSASILRAAGA